MKDEAQKSNSDTQLTVIVRTIKYLYFNRWFIIKAVGVAVVLAIISYLLTPNKFKASTVILPVQEQSGLSSKLGNLGGLASMAGIDVGSLGGRSSLSIDLYPSVAQSTPFLMQMMNVKLPWIDCDTTMTIYEKAKTEKPGIIATIMSLPRRIFGSEPMPADTAAAAGKQNMLLLDDHQRKAVYMLSQEMLSVEIDPTLEVVEISATGETPEQAALLATSALTTMQYIVTNYKTQRARFTLDFVEERYAETLKEYEVIRERFFAYKDSHRDMVEERIDVEYQQLSDEYELSYSLLKTLSSQKEQARMSLMEETPVYSVVEPVVVPKEKDSPNMKLRLVVFVFLGGMFSVGWLVLKFTYYQLFRKEEYERIGAELDAKYTKF